MLQVPLPFRKVIHGQESPKSNMENDTQKFRVVSRTNQAGTIQTKLERTYIPEQ